MFINTCQRCKSTFPVLDVTLDKEPCPECDAHNWVYDDEPWDECAYCSGPVAIGSSVCGCCAIFDR